MYTRFDRRASTPLWVLAALFLAGSISAVGLANAQTGQTAQIQSVSHAQVIPDQRNSATHSFERVGLLTTVSLHAGGGTTVETIPIDMWAYVDSGANTKVIRVSLPLGMAAAPENIANSFWCGSAFPCGGTWDEGVPPTTPPPGPGGGPTEPAPTPPRPPAPTSVPCNTSSASFTQLYSGGNWKQVTEYRRDVNFDSNGNCSHGLWGPPISTPSPVKPK